ncbi:MAG: L,D-transpeptidase [Polyangiaceae bacterium]
MSSRAFALLTLVAFGATAPGCRERPRRKADAEVRVEPRPRRVGFPRHRIGAPAQGAGARDAAPSAGRRIRDPNAAQVYSKARFTWIRRRPDASSEWIGYLTLGGSVDVRAETVRSSAHSGCDRWVAVEPEGYVCLGETATLDARDPAVVLLSQHAADVASPWPYEYARSLGAPRYRGVPTARDERAREGDVDLLRKRIDQARLVETEDDVRAIDPRLVGVELGMTGAPAPPPFAPPPSVLESDADVAFGSTIAFGYEFDHHGRAWLLTWDRGVVPESRVKKYPRSPFHGVELREESDERAGALGVLVAFTQKRAAHRYTLSADSAVEKDDLLPQAPVELGEGPAVDRGGRHFRETSEPSIYVAEDEVVLVAPNGTPPKRLPKTGRRTWIEVSTVGGWLVAFEGVRPVFATLISAGRARMLDDDHMAPTSSTPTGTFGVLTKLRTATMRSDARPDNVHAEVMYTQVFHEGYALHGAYWHDAWGDRKSAGCVNLSPIDAKWLFDWSEPEIPDGWHARHTQPGDAVTAIVVHE